MDLLMDENQAWNWHGHVVINAAEGIVRFRTSTGRIDTVRSQMKFPDKFNYMFVPIREAELPKGYVITLTKRDKGSTKNTWVEVKGFNEPNIKPFGKFNMAAVPK